MLAKPTPGKPIAGLFSGGKCVRRKRDAASNAGKFAAKMKCLRQRSQWSGTGNLAVKAELARVYIDERFDDGIGWNGTFFGRRRKRGLF